MHFKLLLFFFLHCIFYQRMKKPNIRNNFGCISSFQNGLNNLFNSTGFCFKHKVMDGSHKGKNNVFFFTFFGTFFQNAHISGCDIFLLFGKCLSNQLIFLVAVHIYKIHIFDDVFFLLTVRIAMTTKPFRVVTFCEELSPINTHDT